MTMQDLPQRLRDIEFSLKAFHQADKRTLREAADEIERLRAALSWMEDYDPELVVSARAKFGLGGAALNVKASET